MLLRTQYCGEVTEAQLGHTVSLCGWVHRRRDHGGVIFIDLRDREGLVQIVFDPSIPEVFAQAESLRNEYCLQVKGEVRRRPEGTANTDLATGAIEVVCQALTVFNASVTPPFALDDEHISESIRMTYRMLDLRRAPMQHNLRLRHRVTSEVRRYLDSSGFIDIETPMLTKSTPEGARDYLVPSRVHAGEFFALPQSPQLFKQLLMMSGFDRYYQITKCFRDEDLRADRQPEFTQIDCEMSFVDEIDIRAHFEGLVRAIFKTGIEVDLPDPFPVMPYSEAMGRFGSDKPDLRVHLELTELTDALKTVDFKVFSLPANSPTGRVAALRVPQGGTLSRGDIDAYTEYVRIYGAKGLAWIKVNDLAKGREGLQSPIVKNLHDEALNAILQRTGALDGDLIFFGADEAQIVNDSLGALRLKIGHSAFGIEQGLMTEGWRPLWVIDFPMFEYDAKAKRFAAVHHPFTAPRQEDEAYLEQDPSRCLARAYDMVINGWEIGGGSIRIHRAALQSQVFSILNLDAEQTRAKFGFLLDALSYGAPPHGGIAFGLDRIVTLMAGAESIRDVIAFPKTQRVQCLLTQAPSTVDAEQLRELHIRTAK